LRGNNLDSTGGLLSRQATANLFDLLATIKRKGFIEIAFAFGPLWENLPTGREGYFWPADWAGREPWESYYRENLELIAFVRLIVKAAGMNAKFDLMNEGIPPADNALYDGQTEYCRRLWADYTARHGKDDTFGFSVFGTDQKRVDNHPYVYAGNLPYVLDIHCYGAPLDPFGAAESFRMQHARLAVIGFDQGCIIGEAFYDSVACARDILAAARETGRTVFWLTQWPLGQDMKNHNPPVEYGAYRMAGW
jgi:hypothetical protein